jgi:hypothetical protein
MGKHDNPPSVALLAPKRMSFLCGATDGSDATVSVGNHCEDFELSGQLRITIRSALNRAVDEWMAVFDEPLLGQSALDRFCHRAHQFVIDGESYRKRTAPSAKNGKPID